MAEPKPKPDIGQYGVPVVCPLCYVNHCAQPMEYSQQCDWYTCPIHGSRVTAEALWSVFWI